MAWVSPCWSEVVLPPAANQLFRKAQGGHFYCDFQKLQAVVRPTEDRQSFFVLWKPTAQEPNGWIVSLHGSTGYATDDVAVWHRHLKDRNLGLISLQWWMGQGEDYWRPNQIYRQLDLLMQELGVVRGQALLHGFSRGSTQLFALAALDHRSGRRYFRLFVAHSGGVGESYPPTAGIDQGEYGADPLRGSHWVTVAGGLDRNPQRDGPEGMRRTAQWLKQRGAQLDLAIEDPTCGHGAMHLNPANCAKVLDFFESKSG